MAESVGTIRVEGKVAGQRRPLFSDFSVEVPPYIGLGGGKLTLRVLISLIVEAEVEAFRLRQEERKFVQILSRADIERGIMKGKIDMGGGLDTEQQRQTANREDAIATALLAFEDGLYYVFVDEIQRTELEQEISLKPDSRVTFLRLVALAGG